MADEQEWTVQRVMAEIGVSATTAERWVADGIVEGMLKVRAENAQLRADCLASGVPLSVAHKRRSSGWPLEECGTRPVNGARRHRGQNKIVLLRYLEQHGECSILSARRVMGWTHASAVSTLARWVADGTLVRVRRGVYAAPSKELTRAAE